MAVGAERSRARHTAPATLMGSVSGVRMSVTETWTNGLLMGGIMGEQCEHGQVTLLKVNVDKI